MIIITVTDNQQKGAASKRINTHRQVGRKEKKE
jgi:hypothetical protein